MTAARNFLANNLKHLRNRKKIIQEDVAEALGIKRTKLNSYENGVAKTPPLEELIKFSDYYKVSIDTLIKIDLSKLGELKIRELEAGNDIYVTGTKLRILATTVNQFNKENVELVSVKAKAGYMNGYSDPEFIETLPAFSLPMLSNDRKFRVFPITGDSMLPFPENAFMIGEYVENWKTIKSKEKCLVISKNDGFVLKEVHNQIEEKGSLLLKSLNKTYSPYEIEIGDVLEVWKFKGYIDLKWPEGDTISRQYVLDKIEQLRVSF
jgi:transcriptional regulator with XRE-family HTH domain